jgi:hypothetical protein
VRSTVHAGRFSMKSTGETFIIRPGDVLIAVDHEGTGHRWQLIDDAPWRRAYIIFKKGRTRSLLQITLSR